MRKSFNGLAGIVASQLPTKLGAKNWLFIGSAAAGWRSAVIYSIIASCRSHGIEPFAYIHDVLQRLPSMTIDQIKEILPRNWQPNAARGRFDAYETLL